MNYMKILRSSRELWHSQHFKISIIYFLDLLSIVVLWTSRNMTNVNIIWTIYSELIWTDALSFSYLNCNNYMDWALWLMLNSADQVNSNTKITTFLQFASLLSCMPISVFLSNNYHHIIMFIDFWYWNLIILNAGM